MRVPRFRRHLAAVYKLWLGACTFFLLAFFAHADALVRVWVRDQTHLWSGLEEQRTPGYGGPEGILLRAERT